MLDYEVCFPFYDYLYVHLIIHSLSSIVNYTILPEASDFRRKCLSGLTVTIVLFGLGNMDVSFEQQ